MNTGKYRPLQLLCHSAHIYNLCCCILCWLAW